jgi:CheY-like chemotaxis protein
VVLLTSLGQRPSAFPTGELIVTKPVKTVALQQALLLALTGVRRVRDGAGKPAVDSSRQALRILVAEDNELNQQLVVAMLSRLGHQADVVGDGVQALAAASRRHYDVILMDLQMPVLDGIEATRRLIAGSSAKRPRIVALTANATSGDREACLAAGMDDYLAKPIEMMTLRQALARCEPVPADPLDAQRLEQLEIELGGAAPVVQLLEVFRRNAPNLSLELSDALSRRDLIAARRAAHTLRSNAAQFGAAALAEHCRLAEEELLASGSTVQAPAIADAVETVLDAMAQRLAGSAATFGGGAAS